ncbi:hypothetical protein [Streptomyces hydrogenans]|uniref:hypothetical protein n=1 Tax=Streptomyces hydrogenans TaxID=1873719 RepID=UPI003440B66A
MTDAMAMRRDTSPQVSAYDADATPPPIMRRRRIGPPPIATPSQRLTCDDASRRNP